MTDSTTPPDFRGDEPTTAAANPLNRRTMLKGLAVAGVAVPFLAACSSGSDSSGDPATSPDEGGTTTKQDPGTPTKSANGGGADVLTAVSDVPVAGGVILASKGTVVTQPTKGSFKGFSSVCTHMQCTLNNVSGGSINCICHGSRFSIKDGSVINGPATTPLPKMPVKLDGTNVVSA